MSAKKGTASKCVFQGSEPPFPNESKLKRFWLVGALRGAVPFFAQLRGAQILLPTLTPWGEGALRLKTCLHLGTFFRKHRYLILALRIEIPPGNTFLRVTHGYADDRWAVNVKVHSLHTKIGGRVARASARYLYGSLYLAARTPVEANSIWGVIYYMIYKNYMHS